MVLNLSCLVLGAKLDILVSPKDHVYRQLGLDVSVINFHALEVLLLGDYIHTGFLIVSKIPFSTLLGIVDKLKGPLMLELGPCTFLSFDLSTSSF